MCLVILAAVLLEPVSYARAEDEVSTYSEDVPYMNGISVELIRFDLNPFNYVLTDTIKQCHIKRIEFRYDKLSSINYSSFEFVFDFVLKTKLEDGTIIDTNYSYVIDGDSKEDTVSGLDEILIFFDLKDDYFSWSFDYEDLVTKAPNCIVKKDLLQQKSYNTVISSVDCYIRDKSTLNRGLVSHFDFVWYQDFYKQNCEEINYKLYEPVDDTIYDSVSVDHFKFAGKLDSESSNAYYDVTNFFNEIINLLVGIPSVIIQIIKGFWGLAFSLSDLFSTVFPFIPGLIFNVFGVILFITPGVALWMFLKGK